MAKCLLTWDSYKKNICDGFSHLQQGEEFVDMTLAAEGHLVKVHKSLLALASPYIKKMLQSAPCPHPVLFLNCVTHEVLCYILEYVYTGEVQVPAIKMNEFIEAAKALHIVGVNSILPNVYNQRQAQNENAVNRKYNDYPEKEYIFNAGVTSQNLILNTHSRNVVLLPERDANIPTPHTTTTLGNESAPTVLIVNSLDAFPAADNNYSHHSHHAYNNRNKDFHILNSTVDIAQDGEMAEECDIEVEETACSDEEKDNLTPSGNAKNVNLLNTFKEGMIESNNSTQKFNENYASDVQTIPLMSSNIKSDEIEREDFDVNEYSDKTYNLCQQPASDIETQIPSNANNSISVTDSILMPLDGNNYKLEHTISEPNLSYMGYKGVQSIDNEALEVARAENNQQRLNTTVSNSALSDKCYSIDIQMPEQNKGPPKIIINSGIVQHSSIEKTDVHISEKYMGNSPLFMISNRGSLQLILNRYVYYSHHKAKNGRRIRWRCIDYRRKQCKAYLDSNNDIITQRVNAHNHSFHDDIIVKLGKKKKVFSTVAEAVDELNQSGTLFSLYD